MNLMIVDDHLLIRAEIKLLLKNTSTYTVTAEAESGEEALRLLAQQPIDLVIMDISDAGDGRARLHPRDPRALSCGEDSRAEHARG